MALLGEIRKRSWLLIVMIAIGMAGFLMMDMSGPGGGGFGGGQNVGSINGKKISIQEYQNRLNARQNSNVSSFEQNKNVWDELVLESILDQEAAATGYGVSGKELGELMVGANASPLVQQAFFNPQTGQVDMNSLTSIYQRFKDRDNTLPIDTKYAMRNLEEQVVLQQKGMKLSSMVSGALYTPKWLAEAEKGGQITSAEISYVQIPFTSVPDANVQVSDADLTNYLNANAHEYKTDQETRTIEYVMFDVAATDEDKSNLRNELQELAVKFRERNDNEQFAQEEYGTYDSRYVRKDELNAEIADELFELENGNVVGPYEEDGFYRITKLIDRRAVPDSVQARHIIRTANPSDPGSLRAARNTIDSLKNLILTQKIPFDTLAVNFGQAGTANGGDLGMRSAEQLSGLPEVRNLAFYEARRGELNVVESQYGVHLVEVTKIKSSGQIGARVATVSRYIAPSKATQDAKYQEAFAFVRDNRSADDMRKAAQEKGLQVRKSEGLKINDYSISNLDDGESSRKIVKFAFGADPGDVSPEIYQYDEDAVEFYTKGYAVAALNNVYPAGMPSIDAVRSIVTQKVINEKKAANIASKVGNNTDLASIASQYNGTQTDNRNISFPQGLTGEPKVTAALKGLANGATSKPIVGNGGVYIVKMDNKAEAAGGDIVQLQSTLDEQTRQKMLSSSVLIDALKEKTDVSDQRFKFY